MKYKKMRLKNGREEVYFIIALRSSSGVLIGIMLNFSTSTLRIFGVMNAGKLGPKRISFMPRYSSDSKMATAFCSYHDNTIESGKSLICTPKASAKACAILTAE